MARVIALLILALALTVHATPVLAACTTHTVSYDGHLVICTTCCYGSSCTTTCF